MSLGSNKKVKKSYYGEKIIIIINCLIVCLNFYKKKTANSVKWFMYTKQNFSERVMFYVALSKNMQSK